MFREVPFRSTEKVVAEIYQKDFYSKKTAKVNETECCVLLVADSFPEVA